MSRYDDAKMTSLKDKLRAQSIKEVEVEKTVEVNKEEKVKKVRRLNK